MRALRYMVWTIFPLGLALAYLLIGLPHLRWSYAWLDEGQGYDPFAERYFVRCTYVGVTSEFTVHFPADGKCAWILFRESQHVDGES